MRQIEFTEEEINQLIHESVYDNHPIVRRRMQALRLKAQGQPHATIGKMLGILSNHVAEIF